MKFNLEKVRRKLLVKYPYFTNIILNINYKENSKIKNIASDGKTLYYNSQYLDKLSLDEQIFVLAHQICHIAFNHILRSEGKDIDLWGKATDAVINANLIKDGLIPPDGVIQIENAIEYSSEELYEILKEQKQMSMNMNQEGDSSESEQNEQKNKSDSDKSSEKENEQKSNESKDNETGQDDQDDKQNQIDNKNDTKEQSESNKNELNQDSKEQEDSNQSDNDNKEELKKQNSETQDNSEQSENNEEKNDDLDQDNLDLNIPGESGSNSNGSSKNGEDQEQPNQEGNQSNQDQSSKSKQNKSQNSNSQGTQNKNSQTTGEDNDFDEESNDKKDESLTGQSNSDNQEKSEDQNSSMDKSEQSESNKETEKTETEEKDRGESKENEQKSSDENKSNNRSNKSNESGNGNEDTNKESEEIDSHDLWNEAIKKHKEQKENEQNSQDQEQSQPTQDPNNGDEKQNNQEQKEEDSNKSNQNSNHQNENDGSGDENETEPNEKEIFKKNNEEKKEQLQALKEQLLSMSQQAGTTTNSQERDVDISGYAQQMLDWRYVLREAIEYDVDWSTRNAEIEDGVLVSRLEEQPHPEAEIVLDTSGSISHTLLRNFLIECKNILQHSRIKVGCFDTKFYGFEEIRSIEDIENMKFKGGGGTNFDAAVNAFSRRVENKIIFTDGYALMPKMPLDAVWIVFGKRKINPKGGTVIYISEEMLQRLNNNTQYTKSYRR